MSGIDLNQNAVVNLPLGAWNTVLSLIAKGPWDVADPLMQAIRSQLQKPPIPMAQPKFQPNPANHEAE